MTTLYDLTFPTLINALKTQQSLLEKAEAFAAEKGTPVTDITEARLAPDMWPVNQQISIVALHATMTIAKLTGSPAANSVPFGPGTSFCFPLSPASPDALCARDGCIWL